MKPILFLDTNIIIDFALKRKPYHVPAYLLLKLIERKKFRGICSASIITDLYYLIRKKLSHSETLKIIDGISKILTMVPTTREDIFYGLETHDFADFEDAVQYSVAVKNTAKFIITRDKRGFHKSKVKVMDAEEFILGIEE